MNYKFGTLGTMIEEAGTLQEPIGYDFERLYSIDEAIVDFHVSKSQISRDSNSERLSFVLNGRNKKRYKAANLYQLYGFRKPKEMDKVERSERNDQSTGTVNLEVELAVLKERLRSREEALHVKEEALKRFEEEVRDLRQHRDKLTEHNTRLTHLLSAPSISVPELQNVSLEPEKGKKTFWQRLFS